MEAPSEVGATARLRRETGGASQQWRGQRKAIAVDCGGHGRGWSRGRGRGCGWGPVWTYGYVTTPHRQGIGRKKWVKTRVREWIRYWRRRHPG